jgi:predicted acylesterase/phospholipase RssA
MSQIDGGVRPPSITNQWDNTVDKARVEGDKKPGLFQKTPTSTPEHLQAKSEEFKGAFTEKLNQTIQDLGLSPKESKALMEKGGRALEDIVKSTFEFAKGAGKMDGGKISKQALDIAILTANTVATRMLNDLRSEHGSPPQPPKVTPFKDSEGNVRLGITKSSPQIETLVLKGGGMKGVGNPPGLVELEKSGMLKDLKTIVGTSAGALTAVALSSGFSAQEFQKLSDRTDFMSLKAKPEGFKTQYPMVKLSLTGFHAGTALQMMDRESAGSVKNYLDQNWDKVLTKQKEGKLDQGQVNRLQFLRGQDFEIDRTKQMITFKDLDILHEIDPGKFKKLSLTAFNDTDKKLVYMDSKSTPDMPIAIAGRMSMSIPIFFSSMKYDMGEGTKNWTDGGVGSNMPGGKVFDELEKKVNDAKKDLSNAKTSEQAEIATEKLRKAEVELGQARQTTLLMTFDEGGKAYKQMHGPQSSKEKFSLNTLLSGNPKLAKVRVEDTRQVHEGGLNTVVTFHGNVGTFSFSATPEQKAFASLTSRMKTLEYLEYRQNAPSHDSFRTAQRAAESLSESERQAILDGGPPLREDYTDPSLFQTMEQFHNEVQRLHGVAPGITIGGHRA